MINYRKKYLALLLSLIMLMQICVPTFATQDAFGVNIHVDGQDITVSGSDLAADDDISLLVLDQESKSRKYIDQAKVEEGSFSFKFALDIGRYIAKLATNGLNVQREILVENDVVDVYSSRSYYTQLGGNKENNRVFDFTGPKISAFGFEHIIDLMEDDRDFVESVLSLGDGRFVVQKSNNNYEIGDTAYLISSDGSYQEQSVYANGGDRYSSPAVQDGFFYVFKRLNSAYEIWKIDTATHSLVKKFVDSEKNDIGLSGDDIIAAGDRLYTLGYSGESKALIAFNEDLEVEWTKTLHENTNAVSQPVVSNDGSVYLQTARFWREAQENKRAGYLYAFSKSGEEKWHRITEPEVRYHTTGRPVIGPDGYIYTAFEEGDNSTSYTLLSAIKDNGDSYFLEWTKQLDQRNAEIVAVSDKVIGLNFSKAFALVDKETQEVIEERSSTDSEIIGIDKHGSVYLREYLDGSKNITKRSQLTGDLLGQYKNNLVGMGKNPIISNGCIAYTANGSLFLLNDDGENIQMDIDIDAPTDFSGRHQAYGETDVSVSADVSINGSKVENGLDWKLTKNKYGSTPVIFNDASSELSLRMPEVGLSTSSAELVLYYEGIRVFKTIAVLSNNIIKSTGMEYFSGEEISLSALSLDESGKERKEGISFFYSLDPIEYNMWSPSDYKSVIENCEKVKIESDGSPNVKFSIVNDGKEPITATVFIAVNDQIRVNGNSVKQFKIKPLGNTENPTVQQTYFDVKTGEVVVEGTSFETYNTVKVELADENENAVAREYNTKGNKYFRPTFFGLEPGEYSVRISARRNYEGAEYTEPKVIDTKVIVPEGYSNLDDLVNKSKERVVEYYEKLSVTQAGALGDWEAVALAGFGEDLSAEAWTRNNRGFEFWRAIDLYKNDWLYGKTYEKTTDLERVTLGVIASGAEPRNFAGWNLIEELVNALESDGSFSSSWGEAKGAAAAGNTQIFGVLALASADANAVDGYTDEKAENAVRRLMQYQAENGGFGSGGSASDSVSVDMTAMAIVALAEHKALDSTDDALESEIDASIASAMEHLRLAQGEHGGFNYIGEGSTGPNVQSTGWAIQAIVAAGDDPLSSKYQKPGGNPFTALLIGQLPSGAFAHAYGEPNPKANGMATEQASMGLASIGIVDQENVSTLFGPIYKGNEAEGYNVTEPVGLTAVPSVEVADEQTALTLDIDCQTLNIQDGDKVSVDLVQFDSDKIVQVSTVKAVRAVVNGNKANAKLKIPDSLTVGRYYVRLDVGTLPAYGVLRLKAKDIDSGSGGSNSDDPTVSIRIEGYDGTVLAKTNITTDVFDLNPYLSDPSGASATPSEGWSSKRFNKPTVAHVLVKALEKADVSYDFQDYGWSTYLAMVDGDREFDYRNTSGWLYRVDDKLPNVGCQEYEIKGGEEIVWYFGAYGWNTWYTKMESSKKSVKTGEEVTISLEGITTDLSGSSGSGKNKSVDIEGATILVNNEEYFVDGDQVVTDEDGQAVLKFNEKGTYEISAVRERNGIFDIVRPIPLRIRVKGEEIIDPSTGTGAGSSSGTGGVTGPVDQADEKVIGVYEGKVPLFGDDITEKEVLEITDNQIEKLKNLYSNLKKDQNSKLVADEIKNTVNTLQGASSFVKTAENAKAILDACNNTLQVVVSVASSTTNSEVKSEVVKSSLALVDSTMRAMEISNDKESMDRTTKLLMGSTIVLSKSVDASQAKSLESKAVEIAEKAVAMSSKKIVSADQIVVNSDIATVNTDTEELEKLIEASTEKAKSLQSDLNAFGLENAVSVRKTVTIEIPEMESKNVETVMSSELMKKAIEADLDFIKIKSSEVSLRVSPKDISGDTNSIVSLSINVVDKVNLSPSQRLQVPDNSVIVNLGAKNGDEKITDFAEGVEVVIPYNAVLSESKTAQAYYLADDGSLELMEGQYDPVNRAVVFRTPHFSKFFVKETYKATFDDLSGYEWASDAIYSMKEKSIISGRSESVFDPSSNVTRAEFLTMITKMVVVEDVTPVVPYMDVKESDWYFDSISKAHAHSFVIHSELEVLKPNEALTREEMAAILSRALDNHLDADLYMKALGAFADSAEVSDWAQESVGQCAIEGLISGFADRRYAPKQNATRAEAAMILYKLHNKLN